MQAAKTNRSKCNRSYTESLGALILLFLLLNLSSLRAQIPNPQLENFKPLPYKGYYFLVPYKINPKLQEKATVSYQCIVNSDEGLVFFRKIGFSSDLRVHPNGMMSYWYSGKYFILDSTLQMIDSVSCVNGIETDSHEFRILPNGHYLLDGKEKETKDMSAVTFENNRKKMNGSKNAVIKYDVIQELDKNKNLVFEWRTKPYFDLNHINPVYLTDTANVDVTHLNSIDYDSLGNLLLSFRYYDEVQKINKKTNSIIWRMGGWHNNIKVRNDKLAFGGQHDAKFSGSNTITLFDNGYNYDSLQHNVRALEYRINDSTKTAELIWKYSNKNRIVSQANGNVELIDDTTRLISYGKTNKGAISITCEIVNLKNEVLQQLRFPDTLGSYRTYFYKQLPFTLKHPTLLVIKKGDRYLVKTEREYKHYIWNNGSTQTELLTAKPGSCYVYVSDDGVNYTRSGKYGKQKR